MNNREVSEEFINFIISVKKFLRSQIKFDKESRITHQQFIALSTLNKMGDTNLKQLSDKIKVSTSSLCIMLTRMVEEGYVNREIDSNDRRNTIYSLSDYGEDLLKKQMEEMFLQLDGKLSSLSDEKKERFYKCILDINEILKELK